MVNKYCLRKTNTSICSGRVGVYALHTRVASQLFQQQLHCKIHVQMKCLFTNSQSCSWWHSTYSQVFVALSFQLDWSSPDNYILWDKMFCLQCFLQQCCSNSYLQNQIIVLKYWQFVPHALPLLLSSPWDVIFLSCCCRYWYKLGNNSLAYQHWLLLWAMWYPNFKHCWASRGATASAFGLMWC